MGRREMLLNLEQSLAGCSACPLAANRSHIVFGRGAPTARLVLIGEGPGADEDRQGYPFVGRAGQLLDKILVAAELPQEDTYICNVVKCRPPANRLPKPDEIAVCKEFLGQQVRIIKPKLIVCLGAVAAQLLINEELKITRDRGQPVQKGLFWIMPTYHPAALLRDESKKHPVWQDMQLVRDKYRQVLREEASGYGRLEYL